VLGKNLLGNSHFLHINDILDARDEEIERVLQVNLHGPFWVTKAFLSDMVKENQGHIVTVTTLLYTFLKNI
jgi:all-trans-retinol dehydrogenase (NAD+)